MTNHNTKRVKYDDGAESQTPLKTLTTCHRIGLPSPSRSDGSTEYGNHQSQTNACAHFIYTSSFTRVLLLLRTTFAVGIFQVQRWPRPWMMVCAGEGGVGRACSVITKCDLFCSRLAVHRSRVDRKVSSMSVGKK